METEGDPEYLSFLSYLRECDNSYMFEFQPDGASSSVRVKYDQINPTSEMKPNCKSKRIRPDFSAIEAVIEESGGETPGVESDSVRSGKKRRKNNKEEGLSEKKSVFRGYTEKASKTDVSVNIGNEVIASGREKASFEKEGENLVRKYASVDERVEIQSQGASPPSKSATTDVRLFCFFFITILFVC